MTDNNANSNIDEKALNYAWNWFEYHAKQRFTAFNYFLVLVGVVVVGYIKCVELAGKSFSSMDQVGMSKIWWSLASAIGLIGMIISIAFWFLDIRNEELINCARNALESIERSMGLTIRIDDLNRNYLKKSLDIPSRLMPFPWIKHLASHHFWLRSILLLSAFIFLMASLFAATLSSNHNSIMHAGSSTSVNNTTIIYILHNNITHLLL